MIVPWVCKIEVYLKSHFIQVLTVTCILITLLLLSIWTLTFAKILSTLWREPENNNNNNNNNNSDNRNNKKNDKNDSNKKNSHKDKLFTNNKSNSLVVETQESLRSSLLLSPNPPHRLSLPRRYSSNNSSSSSLGEDLTYTEQERLKKKSMMKRRNGLALRKVSAMTSPEAIRGAEMKLLRVFACMLVFFLVGYVPILVYLVVRLVYTGSFSKNENFMLHLLYSVGSTALEVASLLNPLLVLIRVGSFRWRKRTK